MKKTYIAPAIEIVRFDTEEVLNPLVASGIGAHNADRVGEFTFDSSDEVELF